MKLHELHIPQLCARSVGCSHAIARCNRRICCFTIHHSNSATRKDDLLGPDKKFTPSVSVYQRPNTPTFMRDKIKGKSFLPNFNILGFTSAINNRPHHLMTRGIPQGMNNTMMAMPTFFTQCYMALIQIKLGAHADKVIDLTGSFSDDHFNNRTIAKTSTRNNSIFHMIFKSIFRRKNPCDSPLGIT